MTEVKRWCDCAGLASQAPTQQDTRQCQAGNRTVLVVPLYLTNIEIGHNDHWALMASVNSDWETFNQTDGSGLLRLGALNYIWRIDYTCKAVFEVSILPRVEIQWIGRKKTEHMRCVLRACTGASLDMHVAYTWAYYTTKSTKVSIHVVWKLNQTACLERAWDVHEASLALYCACTLDNLIPARYQIRHP